MIGLTEPKHRELSRFGERTTTVVRSLFFNVYKKLLKKGLEGDIMELEQEFRSGKMSHTWIGRLISLFYTLRFYLLRLLTFLPTAVLVYLHITRGISGKYILYAYIAYLLIWGVWRLVSFFISAMAAAGREADKAVSGEKQRANKNPYSNGRR